MCGGFLAFFTPRVGRWFARAEAALCSRKLFSDEIICRITVVFFVCGDRFVVWVFATLLWSIVSRLVVL